jgi:hypothetical protein
MTPVEVLTAAGDLMVRRDGPAAHVWPRASAFLARQALEASLEEFWRRQPRSVAIAGCPMATQLICLRTAVPLDVAHEASYTWAALSSACHYHPYELSPTAEELRGWCAGAKRVIGALADL